MLGLFFLYAPRFRSLQKSPAPPGYTLSLYAAYVILLRNMMDMGESMSPKPVTENTLFYGDNLMERYGCYQGK